MLDSGGNVVYCTLLLSDNYLPGAVVLAHSLRDNGSKATLVALFTPESLQPATINELKTVYDEIIPVHPLSNRTPANLWLMDRPDLISTFTKIELWRQTQFKRIVYIDCDVVALRAPDELLSLDVDFAAAPDVGWPDCFNSGVMVLRPNMQDYHALLDLAEKGISFDGADQGLLNLHFRNWHRLSFTYNCTPSANYQYIPAYKHFQSTISLIHFIGAQKPWNLSRQVFPLDSPYNQLLGRWWAIYDRHYRPGFMSDGSNHQPTSGHTAPSEFQPPQNTAATLQSQGSHVTDGGQASGISHQHQSVLQSEQHPVSQSVPQEVHWQVQQPGPQPVVIERSVPQPGQQPQYVQPLVAQPVYQPVLQPVPQPVPSGHQPTPPVPQWVPPPVSQEVPQQLQQPIHQSVPQSVLQTAYHSDESRADDSHDLAYHVTGTGFTASPAVSSSMGHAHTDTQTYQTPEQTQQPILSAVPQYVRGEERASVYIQPHPYTAPVSSHTAQYHWQPVAIAPPIQPQPSSNEPTVHHRQPETAPKINDRPPKSPSHELEDRPFEPPKLEWDASREPPPLNTKPEGIGLQKQTYIMSEDTELFQPPESYPEAPKDMYYQLPPTKPEPRKLTQVFPWESRAPKPTRVFHNEELSMKRSHQKRYSTSSTGDESGQSVESSLTSWEDATESWQNYSRLNAWDEVPAIQKYIQSIQRPRKAKTQILSGGTTTATTTSTDADATTTGPETEEGSGSSSVRLTDFPSEIERPSLPVTPAPIRRPSAWTDGGGDCSPSAELPAAQGVPNQEDWNPLARLEELRRLQNEVLENPDLLLERAGGLLSMQRGHGNYPGS